MPGAIVADIQRRLAATSAPWAQELAQRLETVRPPDEFKQVRDVCRRRLDQCAAKTLHIPKDGQAMMTSIEAETARHPTAATLATLCRRHGARRWAGMVADGLHPVGFPWKNTFIHGAEIDRMFDALRTLGTTRIDPGQRFVLKAPAIRFRSGLQMPLGVVVTSAPDDYARMDVLADCFTETARMQARRRDQSACPLALWNDALWSREMLVDTLPKALTAVCPHTGATGLSPWVLREAVYHRTRECTQFRPSLATSVINHYSARRILDFSAGWGDRLLGAMASTTMQAYTGIDPNKRLAAGHRAMISRFCRPDQNVQMLYQPAESVALDAHPTVDLVFTSPPFHNFEVYDDADPNQSITNRHSVEAWLAGFLFPCLARFWNKLDVGGHLVLHLNDARQMTICEPTVLYAEEALPGCRLDAVIGAQGGGPGVFRPLWVFVKCPAGVGPGTAPTGLLHRHFPAVHAAVTSRVELVTLESSHMDQVAPIVQDAVVMQRVGGGPWSAEKLGRVMAMCDADLCVSADQRTHFYWGVRQGERMVGVVCIHPVKYSKGSFITIVVAADAQRRGVGSGACRAALEAFRAVGEGRSSPGTVYADVHQANTGSLAMFERLGFARQSRPVSIGSTPCVRWRYDYA
jgi:ribosomal protein S18 acetylase RimI-like enzyme